MSALRWTVLFGCLLAIGCMRSKGLQSPAPSVPLAGTTWVAVEIGGQAIALNPGQRAPMMAIDAGTDRFRGFGGCNNAAGTVARSGSNGIAFKDVAVTRRACPELDLESRFLAALNEVTSYRIAGDALVLLDTGGSVRARLQRAE